MDRIKNLSLDQKAKLYFMGMVKAGLIDTLPENPKAAFVQQMMDSELNESIGVNLKDLTFDMVTKVFKDEYENENPIAFPNADDSLLKVRNESDFNNWKSNTMEKFGNVQVQLKPEADVWFDKVKIMGDEFKATQDKSDTAKKSFIDSEREAGRSID